jgi:hypothetical protein
MTRASFTMMKRAMPPSFMTAALIGIDSIAPAARPISVVRMSIDSMAASKLIQTRLERNPTCISELPQPDPTL